MRQFTLILLSAVAASGAGLQVKVLEGNGVTNSIHQGFARDIVVEVLDSAGRPVEDAQVTVVLPARGVGAYFGEPFHNAIATKETDDDGRVAFRRIHLRKLTGEFPVRVLARRGELSGEASASQTNSDVAEGPEKRFSRRRMVIYGILAGGAAAGIITGLHNADKGPSVFSVTPGAPTLSGPR